MAFVLAGGKSTRMGRDKAFLELDGQTLLVRALALARSVARDVQIVGDRKKFSAFGPVVEDVYPERGPLGGIHAALAGSATEFNLMLAVDLPFIAPPFLEYLIAQARAGGAVVTVPRTGGRWQPLCAVYRRAFATVAERSLLAGMNKIDTLFLEVETRVLDDSEWSKAGFSAGMFRNLNTPEELETARRGREEPG
ncbi:MAG: molybdenum cofactor guanylyltransferase [Acidobacteriia bacterium]|nr:molybdenum cofactor guanylyltransferase [Terriglobia bacterium]